MRLHGDVFLVNANRLRPPVAPLALDYLADTLKAQKVRVRLIDLCQEPHPARALKQALSDSEPILVAVTFRNTDDCYLASGEGFVSEFRDLVGAIRRDSAAPVVVGGAGFSVFPAPLLRALGADYGIAGDGEIPLALLAKALAEDGEWRLVPGLVWEEDGQTRANPPWLGPLEALPPRGRDLLDNRWYLAEGGQAGIETKRGCDRGCIYCADPVGKGRRIRTRRPDQVADEFEALLAQGVDHFHLCDSEFNLPADHALAVCQELTRRGLGEKARWYTYASPAGCTEELARAMRAAGCVGIDFGVDSGDDGMLASLGRDFRVDDLHRTAHACRAAGLVFMYDLLLGAPGETRESLRRTIEVVKRISPSRVGVSLGVRIYAGTTLGKWVLQEGYSAANPNLRGMVVDNPDLLHPVFYLSADLGDDPEGYLAQLVGGDHRFFFPTESAGTEAYNYSNHSKLAEAIRGGCRGAYWDILRRLSEGD